MQWGAKPAIGKMKQLYDISTKSKQLYIPFYISSNKSDENHRSEQNGHAVKHDNSKHRENDTGDSY